MQQQAQRALQQPLQEAEMRARQSWHPLPLELAYQLSEQPEVSVERRASVVLASPA